MDPSVSDSPQEIVLDGTCHIKPLFRSYTQIYPCPAEIQDWLPRFIPDITILLSCVSSEHLCLAFTSQLNMQIITYATESSQSQSKQHKLSWTLNYAQSVRINIIREVVVANCFTLSMMKPACAGAHTSTRAEDRCSGAACAVRSQWILCLFSLLPHLWQQLCPVMHSHLANIIMGYITIWMCLLY